MREILDRILRREESTVTVGLTSSEPDRTVYTINFNPRASKHWEKVAKKRGVSQAEAVIEGLRLVTLLANEELYIEDCLGDPIQLLDV